MAVSSVGEEGTFFLVGETGTVSLASAFHEGGAQLHLWDAGYLVFNTTPVKKKDKSGQSAMGNHCIHVHEHRSLVCMFIRITCHL